MWGQFVQFTAGMASDAHKGAMHRSAPDCMPSGPVGRPSQTARPVPSGEPIQKEIKYLRMEFERAEKELLRINQEELRMSKNIAWHEKCEDDFKRVRREAERQSAAKLAVTDENCKMLEARAAELRTTVRCWCKRIPIILRKWIVRNAHSE